MRDVLFHSIFYRAPFAGWDAWAIWNLHARAFFLSGGAIWKTRLYRIAFSHPDYPLLLPLNVARLWFFAGQEAPSGPAALAFLYTFGTAGLLGGAVTYLKGLKQGVLAIATLLAMTKYVWAGFQECADVPQSFYILGAVVTLSFYEETGDYAFLAFTGFSAGLSLWNKNEGWMFIGCFVLAQLIACDLAEKWRFTKSQLYVAAGAAPPVIVAAIYKMRNPARSDVLSWYATKSGWMRAFDPQRLLYILHTFGTTLWNLDKWLISPVLVLALFAALVGFDRTNPVRKTARTGLVTIVLMIIGYVFVYATSASDLAWYLNSSLDRLYLQLWPSFLLCFFVETRTPFSPKLESRAQKIPPLGLF